MLEGPWRSVWYTVDDEQVIYTTTPIVVDRRRQLIVVVSSTASGMGTDRPGVTKVVLMEDPRQRLGRRGKTTDTASATGRVRERRHWRPRRLSC